MLYSSRNGTLFYYDRVLYTWQVAEPTMLFLLGLESVTSYMNALSDALVIANSVYIKDQNDVVPFEHFKIYDKIHSYLSQLSSIEDFEYYLRFSCNGLKLLLNELTGTGSDRTVPIIFRNDINNKSIDLNSSMYRLESSETATLYDRQAQKIRDIFLDAGYSGGSLVDTSDIEDASIAKYLKAYNVTLSEYYSERRKNGRIYKLLDYSAMYSYALGVLYGCRCLGFSPTLIWRIDPKFWYNGEFKNLVSTAWYTFRFHHTHYIPELDEASNAEMRDRYKGITPNRLWNIGSDKEIDKLDELPLKASELNCYALHVDKTYDVQQVLTNEQAVAEPLIYSQFSESTPKVTSVYMSYHIMSSSYRCFILSVFGDSLPISGDYHFVISITDRSDIEQPNNIIELDPIDKQSSSKNLFIFSTSEDDYILYEYLDRFYNGHEQIEISVEIKLGSDSLYKEDQILRWDDLEPQGECLPLSNLESLSWVSVNNIISDGSDQSPKTGIVAEKDSPIVRYLADDPIVIRKAYQWVDPIYLSYISDDSTVLTSHQIRESKYLSPNEDEIYFIATGNIGWSYFDENLYKKSSALYPYKLSIIQYSNLDSEDRAGILPSRVSIEDHDYTPINYARRKKDSVIVTYYRCYISDSNKSDSFDDDDDEDTFMYGIFNGNVSIGKEKDAETDTVIALTYDYSTLVNYHDDEAHKNNPTSAVGFFKEFISEDLFASCYEAPISIISGFTLENWYDIDVPVSIFIDDSDSDYMYTGDGESQRVLISNYGYTPSKASAVAAFIYNRSYRDENNLALPEPYEMRFYNNKYWSSTWPDRQWCTANQVPDNIYMLAGSITPIYRGQVLVQYEATVYSNINRNDNQYIFNNSSIQYLYEGFIAIKPFDWDQSIDTVWRYGYTTHVCPYILRDDNGNYLTSDGTSSGTPLVWYDQESSMYWNGLADIMRWQTLKPILNGQLVYITTTDQYSQAIDDPTNEIISLDGSNYISYSEFYSDNTRGAVRYKVKVFNPIKDEGIIDCLVDDKNDPEHPENAIYCIPGVTITWVPRNGISNEGYRFVDGTTVLYTGANSINVVIDDDFVD